MKKIDFEEILKNEGLSDWKIKFNTGGGLCISSRKEIWMADDKNDIALFLHEVAHAKTNQYNEAMNDKTGHHSIFADEFTNLVRKYLTKKDIHFGNMIYPNLQEICCPMCGGRVQILKDGYWCVKCEIDIGKNQTR